MHSEQLRAEVAAMVRQASISPQDATAALDGALASKSPEYRGAQANAGGAV